DAMGSGVGERTESGAEIIKTAVEHERKRLRTAQRNGIPAKTELGRELEKRLGTVGVVADHYVEIAANEILRTKAGEKGKPKLNWAENPLIRTPIAVSLARRF